MTTIEENTNHNHQQLRILSKFRNRLEKEIFIHSQAGNYYMKSSRWFVIPGIIITGSSSVISFLGTSDIINDDVKIAFNITVGVLTASAAILQSISSSFGFETRTSAFSKAADAYDTLITKIEFELCNPNENFQEFCDKLEIEILKIKNDCKYLPPLFCHKNYEKEMKRCKAFKEEQIDNNSLTSILIHTPNNSHTNKKAIHLSVPNIKNNIKNMKTVNATHSSKDENTRIDTTVNNQLDNQIKNQINNQVKKISKVINNTVDTKDILKVDNNLVQNNSNKIIKKGSQLSVINNFQI